MRKVVVVLLCSSACTLLLWVCLACTGRSAVSKSATQEWHHGLSSSRQLSALQLSPLDTRAAAPDLWKLPEVVLQAVSGASDLVRPLARRLSFHWPVIAFSLPHARGLKREPPAISRDIRGSRKNALVQSPPGLTKMISVTGDQQSWRSIVEAIKRKPSRRSVERDQMRSTQRQTESITGVAPQQTQGRAASMGAGQLVASVLAAWTILSSAPVMGADLPASSILTAQFETANPVADSRLNSLLQPKMLEKYIENVADQEKSQFEITQVDRTTQKLQQMPSAKLTQEAQMAALKAQPQWFNYASAFAASVVATLVMHPVETVKNRKIVDAEKGRSNATSHRTASPLEDFLSLYDGLSGAILMYGPSSAIYLGVYEAVKNSLLADANFAAYPIFVYLLSASIGKVTDSFVKVPAEALKARMQVGQEASLAGAFKNVLLDADGRTNTARAWEASLWRDVPYGAIELAVFEGVKKYLTESPQSLSGLDINSLAGELLLGATAGAFAALFTTPFDVVTIRILTQECDNPLGFGGMTKKVLEEGGFAALCTGWRERVAFFIPATGVFLSCYCAIKKAAVENDVFPF